MIKYYCDKCGKELIPQQSKEKIINTIFYYCTNYHTSTGCYLTDTTKIGLDNNKNKIWVIAFNQTLDASLFKENNPAIKNIRLIYNKKHDYNLPENKRKYNQTLLLTKNDYYLIENNYLFIPYRKPYDKIEIDLEYLDPYPIIHCDNCNLTYEIDGEILKE